MRCYSCQLSAGDQADTWHNQISYIVTIHQSHQHCVTSIHHTGISRYRDIYLDIYMEQYLDSYQLTITRNIYNIYTDLLCPHHQQQQIQK